MVGMQGIEPCTTCTQNKHATDTPHPDIYNNVILILFTFTSFLSSLFVFNRSKTKVKHSTKHIKLIKKLPCIK